MAFFGVTCGMILGAIASFVGCFVFGMPLWMGLLLYSSFGAATTMMVVMTMYLRQGDDDAPLMSTEAEAYLDEQWMKAAQNSDSETKAQKYVA